MLPGLPQSPTSPTLPPPNPPSHPPSLHILPAPPHVAAFDLLSIFWKSVGGSPCYPASLKPPRHPPSLHISPTLPHVAAFQSPQYILEVRRRKPSLPGLPQAHHPRPPRLDRHSVRHSIPDHDDPPRGCIHHQRGRENLQIAAAGAGVCDHTGHVSDHAWVSSQGLYLLYIVNSNIRYLSVIIFMIVVRHVTENCHGDRTRLSRHACWPLQQY